MANVRIVPARSSMGAGSTGALAVGGAGVPAPGTAMAEVEEFNDPTYTIKTVTVS